MNLETILLNWLLLFPFIAAALIAVFPRILRFVPPDERESVGAAPAATAIICVVLSLVACAALGALVVRRGDAFADYFWTPDFFQFRLRLDRFGLFALLALLGSLTFSALSAAAEGQRDHVRWAAFTTAAAAFIGVILAADLVLLYLFWEVAALALWVALGPPHGVGRRFLVWYHAGGVCLLLGILWAAILSRETHLYTIGSGLLVHRLSSIKWVGFVLAGGLGLRLAVAPVHLWLPDLTCGSHGKWRLALAGAAVLVAGYAAARLLFFILPSYVAVAVAWLPTVMGLVTVAYAGARAVLADDMCDAASHVLIAFAGQIMLGIGLGMRGRPDALAGAIGLLVPLALGAPLLAAGVAGDGAVRVWRDLRTQGAARVRLIATAAAACTFAGLPPLAGFAGQRAVAEAAWHVGSVPLLLAALIAPALILAHGAKAVIMGIGSPARAPRANGERWRWWWTAAATLVSLVLGLGSSLWWPYLLSLARGMIEGNP